MKPEDFQKSLEALDLPAIILIIGLLSQRALELMAETKEKEKKKKPSIISPKLIL